MDVWKQPKIRKFDQYYTVVLPTVCDFRDLKAAQQFQRAFCQLYDLCLEEEKKGEDDDDKKGKAAPSDSEHHRPGYGTEHDDALDF